MREETAEERKIFVDRKIE